MEKQADAIVTLQLYRLTNTEIVALQDEMKKLDELMKKLELILSRVEFALADKKLTHQSNIDYLNQIEIFIKNNLLYCTMKKKVGNMNES